MKNILEYLEITALKNREKIAIIEEEKKCNYIDLLENSQKVGSELIKHIPPRQAVPILLEKGINTIYAFFGTIYAGAFYVLLNPELPAARLKNILEKLESQIIITDTDNVQLAQQIAKNEKVLMIENLKNAKIQKDKLQEIRNQALDIDPLYANFTSGSTGIPKGVVISHQSVIDFIDIFTDTFDINEKDIIGNQAPFDFDVSVKDIYSCIKTGATLAIIPKKLFSMPVKLLDYICEKKITTLIWAVSALCLITTFHGLDYKEPKTINKILFSGEVMPIKHIKEWIKHLPNAQYVNLYGPTEITCNCTYYIIDTKKEYEKLPIGKSFPNEEVFLLNEDDKLVTENEVTGEICVRGACLALGYYNNKEQTKSRFIQNPLNDKYIDLIYRTGDLGEYIDGELYFVGRKDFQIKHMGHRIELEEIERTMEKVEGLERSCCVYNEQKGKINGFFVGSIEKETVLNYLRENLPVFMIPNTLTKIDIFPITKNGKIDRKKLMEKVGKK